MLRILFDFAEVSVMGVGMRATRKVCKSALFDSVYFSSKFCEELPSGRGCMYYADVYLKDRRYWFCEVSPLFDGSYYVNLHQDLRDLDYPPILHYLNYGFHEGRRASCFIDVEFVLDQLSAMEGGDGGLSFGDLLRNFDGVEDIFRSYPVNPNILFDVEFFLSQYGEVSNGLDALSFYFHNNGYHPETGRPLETTPLFSFEKYLDLNVDVVDAGINPLKHLLMYGLDERRLSKINGLVDEKFITATAGLYGKSEFLSHYYFIRDSHFSGRVGGPAWPGSLGGRGPNACAHTSRKKYKLLVGVVLYENSREEVERLNFSIKREIERCGNADISYLFFVNCEGYDVYREILGGEVLVRSGHGNIGFGAAHNALMERAFDTGFDLYLGVNPDGYFLPNTMDRLINFYDFFSPGCVVEMATFPAEHPKWYDPVHFDTKWVSGAAFLLDQTVWNEVGGFDENIHMYCEDVDLSWRARLSGCSLKVCPVAPYYHDVTNRFLEGKEKGVERDRQRSMLLGAYYLCVKWGGDSQAEEIKNILFKNGLIEDECQLPEIRERVNSSEAKRVVDFKHWLRFSESRFWE